MSCTNETLISFWPRTRIFSQFLQVWNAVTFDSPWSRVGHGLRPIFMLWLVKIWQESSCGKLMHHLGTSWSWQSFVSCCDVFNCIFPLDVHNEIQLLSRFFCYSCLVCLLSFWLRNARLVKVVGNPIADGICSPPLMCKRVEKSQAVFALLDGFQELHLDW